METKFSQLSPAHLRYVVQRVPKDVRELLTARYGRLYLGGGFIRETVAGNVPVDIDMFAESDALAELAAEILKDGRGEGTRLHKTKNAITVLTPNRLPVQIIKRWTFDNAYDLVRSFDFTVCQAAIWRAGNRSNSAWQSATSDRFYPDLASRSLVYTSPVREEEAGGSLLRVLKFLKRGYNIQVTSLGDVLGRLYESVDAEKLRDGLPAAAVLDGLLREVDPLLVIDGFDVEDDHVPPEGTN